MTKFRSLVNLASDAAVAIDNGSIVVACNERAATLLGYTPNEMIGRHCHEVVQAVLANGDPLCSPSCEGKLCFAHHAPFAVGDCALRHKDGRWLRAAISTLVAPAPGRNGVASSTVAVVFLRQNEKLPPDAAADRQLRISTLGRFGLTVGDRDLPIDRWHRKHALMLLKLLVTHRRESVHREYVIECLWPDADERRGRERLKVTTYFLRQQLRAAGMLRDAIAVTGATYALRRDAVWLDCEAFESLFDEGRAFERQDRPKDALLCFEKAERMYRGEYLPEERYADWCAEERERLFEIHFDVLDHMVKGYLERGDQERAAQICRLALSREPCRESFHRALMVCLLRLGQYDRAIAQFNRCRRSLGAELGVEPAPETRRLYRDAVAARMLDSPGLPAR